MQYVLKCDAGKVGYVAQTAAAAAGVSAVRSSTRALTDTRPLRSARARSASGTARGGFGAAAAVAGAGAGTSRACLRVRDAVQG